MKIEPPKSSQLFELRLLPAELRRLRRQARREGVAVTTLIRAAIGLPPLVRGRPPKQSDHPT